MARLPGMENIRPPKPTQYDEPIAMRIAERIIAEVNLDDFYWEPEQLPKKVDQMAAEIMRGTPCNDRLIYKLHDRHGDWAWEGVPEHCFYCGPDIAKEELAKAVAHWQERYDVKEPIR